MKQKNNKSNKKIIYLSSMIFLVIAFFLVKSSSGVASIYWMNIYQPDDFQNMNDLFHFLFQLRTGIPPVLSTIEILVYQLLGNLDLIVLYFYRASLVLSFFLAVIIYPQKTWVSFLKFTIALLLLFGVVIIHPGNPQIYDLIFPLFILLFLIFYKFSMEICSKKSLLYGSLFLSGLFLSMTELLRSFFLPIAILTIILVLFSFLSCRKSRFGVIIFLLPILLFSGVWHGKLFLNNKQLLITNNTGFSLIRAWKMPLINRNGTFFLIDDNFIRYNLKGFIKEPPNGKKRWTNLNTQIHHENSELLKEAVIKKITKEPIQSFFHVFNKVKKLVHPQTAIYTHQPNHYILKAYKFFGRMLFYFLILNLILLAYQTIYLKRFNLLTHSENLLLLITILSILSLAVGDTGEEGRFFISILPLLLAQKIPDIKKIFNFTNNKPNQRKLGNQTK